MKGDLQFGLLLALVLVAVVGPRFLPDLEDLSSTATVSATVPDSVGADFADNAHASDRRPPESAAGGPTMPSEPEQPLRLPDLGSAAPGGSTGADALTDVAPEGFATGRENRARDRRASSGDGVTTTEAGELGVHRDVTTEASPAPTRARIADRQPPAAGPVHPYYQRFLDRGEYYVRSGDTLNNIAQRLYQNARMADAILHSNRKLLSQPEDVRAGMLLRLPAVAGRL